MGKKKKTSKDRAGGRIRVNPITGEEENVPGTKAGKRRTRLSFGHPLRTHDLNFKPKEKSKSKSK
jgi:hypothetical protein